VKVEELALQRKRYAHLTDEEWRWLLQQVEGRQRTRGKLPTMAEIADWWYPVRLSCEQCSSEETARYKAKILHDASTQVRGEEVLVDLTGGYGVDTYFLSENFAEVHYVEQDEELCRIAKHNFALTRPQIQVHNMQAEEFLKTDVTDKKWVVYIDPARRDKHGGKVFRIEDCEPNVVEILPALQDKAERIIIKLSPMLDITAALRSLPIAMDIHVVAVNNEVKEVQLWSKEENSPSRIHAVNLGSQTTEFSFVVEEEKNAQCPLCDDKRNDNLADGMYIYEPNAAILKAGAYKLIGTRYNLKKMGTNTHLYLSKKYLAEFPGRIWKLRGEFAKDRQILHASVMTRNYPLSADQLRKKLKIKEGEQLTVIGARLGEKPVVMLAEKC
jgi:hypothetical protein